MKKNDIETLRLREALIPLLTFILAVATYFSSKAQEVTIGPKIGYTTTTAAGDDFPDYNASRSSVLAGGFVKFNSTGIVAVQPELLFHGKGGEWKTDPAINYKLSVNYLELPVLIMLQLPMLDMFYPHVYAGPYAAFTLNSTEEGEFFYDKDPNINDFDGGAVVGGGLDMMFNRLLLGVDARYGMGFLNIYDQPDTATEPDIKNRSFTLCFNLGYTL